MNCLRVCVVLVYIVLLPVTGRMSWPDMDLRKLSDNDCHSYKYLTWKLNSLFDKTEAIGYRNEVLDDRRITNQERTKYFQIFCRSVKDAAKKAKEFYRSCSNVQQIKQTMTHLGPFCTSSGNFSPFLTSLLANFTEIRAIDTCVSDVYRVEYYCQTDNLPSIPEDTFDEDLAELKRIIKERFQCAMRGLKYVRGCLKSSNLQILVLLWGQRHRVYPGLHYKVTDFF